MQYEIKCVIKTVDRVIDRNEERGVGVRVLGCDYNSPELAVLKSQCEESIAARF